MQKLFISIFLLNKIFISGFLYFRFFHEKCSFAQISFKLGSVHVSEDSNRIKRKFEKKKFYNFFSVIFFSENHLKRMQIKMLLTFQMIQRKRNCRKNNLEKGLLFVFMSLCRTGPFIYLKCIYI